MIKNKDRSKWFGASDTHYIMGNWNTKSFAKWWCIKLGLIRNNFQTKETLAGTYYEHKIAKAIEEKIGKQLELDRQIKIKKYKLRINLDAETDDAICEIKTFKSKNDWGMPQNYIMQVRVQGYFTKKKCQIWAYPMEEENYKNYFIPIDKEKLLCFDIKQDYEFIEEYKHRIKYLKECLKKGIMPQKVGK